MNFLLVDEYKYFLTGQNLLPYMYTHVENCFLFFIIVYIFVYYIIILEL